MDWVVAATAIEALGSSGLGIPPELLELDEVELDDVELDVELLELEFEEVLLEADELDDGDGLGLLSDPPPELQAARTELSTNAEKSPFEILGSA